MKGNIIRQQKFTFSNHQLAYKVRHNMYNALIPFDDNGNGLFDEDQIIHALIQILGENQNEIKYVISNVFRYDKDGDRKITFEEFVNFCVQAHFGQMAIQRLHRNQVYSRGKQRVMNLDQFEITLNESLKHINSTGSRQQYEVLFSEVDLDKDGWIKYEDYFMFLREYFGSLSVASQQPINVQLDASQVQPYRGNIDFPQQRFARLIYTQLKVSVMEHDIGKNLSLRRQEIGSVLENLFGIGFNQKGQIVNLIVGSQSQLEYQKFLKLIVPFYFCEYDIQKSSVSQFDEDSFVNNVRKATIFVRVKPSEVILRQIFRKADSRRKGYLQRNEYINLLGGILQSYKFDTRGLSNHY